MTEAKKSIYKAVGKMNSIVGSHISGSRGYAGMEIRRLALNSGPDPLPSQQHNETLQRL